MSYANGRLPDSALTAIPGGRLEHEAAAAWMAMRHAALLDGIPAAHFIPGGPDSSYRTYARQVYYKQFWASQGHPEKAATPGTSNHGLGNAVDCPFADAQAWLLRNCHRFGWSHDEGLRVGEPWHFTFVGGYHVRRSRFSGYPKDERRWVREYDRLVRARRDPHRRAVLRRVMTERRKQIWQAAQRGGWDKLKRRERYRTLLARTR